MPSLEELRLMAKVAHLYYDLHHTQSQIADATDISQATVSRLLKRAEEEKIVRITVSTPPGVYTELEEQLQQSYGLKEAIVAHCPQDEDETVLRAIGSAAAFYVESTLKKNEVVGISSWSATLLQMVDSMHPLNRKMDTQVIQILGGVGNPAAEVHAARLTERLAKLLQGTATFLPAPGVVGTSEAQQVMMEDTFVKAAVQLFDRVSLALVGIGAVEPSRLLASSGNVFSPDELTLLKTMGAAGDICLRFFDLQGKPVITPLNDCVIGITLEQLRKVERTVGIAGGERKTNAIRGALTGRWVNVLITDNFTAERLLRTG